jgi:small subunit ribosomal protein S13
MARILGINLPAKKRIEIGLTYLYGIGQSRSREILKEAGVDPNKRTDDVTEAEANQIRDVIESGYSVEGDLRRDISTNIKRLKEIGSYRGERHKRGLPVRGQTTKTNARTKRGRRVTVGSGRKKSTEKT